MVRFERSTCIWSKTYTLLLILTADSHDWHWAVTTAFVTCIQDQRTRFKSRKMDRENPALPQDDELFIAGRIEELAIYDQDRDLLRKQARPSVSCRICGLYSGTPETIEEHEASHSANGELKKLPDLSDLYKSFMANIEKKKELDKELQRESEWRCRLAEIFKIPEESLAKLKISVRRKGTPVSVQEFENFLNPTTRLEEEPGAVARMALRVDDQTNRDALSM